MAPEPNVAGQQADTPEYDSYARLSWNPNTRELEKVDDQHADNAATIGRRGGRIGMQLDDGMSAWKAGARRKVTDPAVAGNHRHGTDTNRPAGLA